MAKVPGFAKAFAAGRWHIVEMDNWDTGTATSSICRRRISPSMASPTVKLPLVHCGSCSKMSKHKRSDAKFCSVVCKQREYRSGLRRGDRRKAS
jgi:hypothetical protein